MRLALLVGLSAYCCVGWALQDTPPTSFVSEVVHVGKTAVRDPFAGVQALWELVGPGGKLHPATFLEYKGHLAVELLLLLAVIYLLIGQARKPVAADDQDLTEAEIQQLCDDWEPEPLAPPRPDQPPELVIHHTSAKTCQVNGDPREVLNMSSFGFLGVSDVPAILTQSAATVQRLGVGSCGPRGFLGTLDVHLQLEDELAAFMATEEAIIYSYDMATVPSIIPAFANKRDLILCDEACNYSIRLGCDLSRAKVVLFKHNDMEDLERQVLAALEADRKLRKPLNRRYICVEGIYHNTGEVAPLDRIFAIKERYKFRVVLDESVSLGVMGPSGRGACEHFGLSPGDMPVVVASLSNALGSVGGFCCGHRDIVDHQRLSGSAYVYSASLPPYLATAASYALKHLQSNGATLLPAIASNAATLRAAVSSIPGLTLRGSPQDAASPLLHVGVTPSPGRTQAAEEALLERVCEDMLIREAVLVSRQRYVPMDKGAQPPSLRLTVLATHTREELLGVAEALRRSLARVAEAPGGAGAAASGQTEGLRSAPGRNSAQRTTVGKRHNLRPRTPAGTADPGGVAAAADGGSEGDWTTQGSVTPPPPERGVSSGTGIEPSSTRQRKRVAAAEPGLPPPSPGPVTRSQARG